MAKTIMISNEVYNDLKNIKTENKSYSDVLKELLSRNKTKKGSNLFSCFGIIKKDREWEDAKKEIKRGWENWSRRYV